MGKCYHECMSKRILPVNDPDERSRICRMILKGLPEWFGIAEAFDSYINDVRSMATWVACVEERECGFISINRPNEFTAEIHVMGVLKEFHRHGVGQMLVKFAEQELIAQNFRFLQVKTLSPSRENIEYEMTRRFYFRMGFVPVEEFKNIWGEENPCLQMIKAL